MSHPWMMLTSKASGYATHVAQITRTVRRIAMIGCAALLLGSACPVMAADTKSASASSVSPVAAPQPSLQKCDDNNPDCMPGANPHSPVVTWTAVPAANSYVLPTDTLSFGASATDKDTYVAHMEFFIDDKNRMVFNGAAFQTTVSNLAPGAHTAVAIAYDSQGRSGTTDHVPFTVRTSVIMGNIDGVSSDGVISGWACSSYLPPSISVDLYLGGASGSGTGIGRFTANAASEPGVASACGVSSGNYRFTIALSSAQRVQFGGQTIYVHGISPVGAANSLLGNSGKFVVPPAVRDAQVVSQSVASSMPTGTTQTVSVQMRNTGNYTWSASTGFKLGAVGGSTVWGTARVALTGDVAPGQTASFTFKITAPSTAGTYTFQWQMLQEGVAWFGPATPAVGISAIAGSITANPATCSIAVGNTSCASVITWSSNSGSSQILASNLDGSGATVMAGGQSGSQTLGGITPAGRRFTLTSGGFTLGSVETRAIPTPEVATSVSVDYDELGRIIARRDAAGQVKQSYQYDANGNLTRTIDALGHTQSLTYDALGRIATATGADNAVTSYSYDAADRVVLVVDPRNNAATYDYDGFGQLWRQVSPDTGSTTYAFDAGGLLQSMTRADGVQTTYGYDGLNRLASATAGGLTQQATYDSCANGVGRLCRVVDATGATSYSYTPEGEIGGRGFSIGGTTYALGYAYDGLGRLSAVVYPDGNRLDYSYGYGHVTRAALTANGVSTPLATALSYRGGDAAFTGWTASNGLTNSLGYDSDGRLISITVPGIQSLSLAYDAADRITRITNGMDATMTQAFQYDSVSHLTSVTSTAASEGFGYDANGNRTSHGVNGVTVGQGIDPMSNRLQNAGGQSLSYDANGNLTMVNGLAQYHYDPFNRMDAGAGTAYYVGAEGQRLRKTGSAGTTWFAPDKGGAMMAENANGGWIDYLWVNGRLIGRVAGGQIYAIHADQVGRPESATNASKARVWMANNFAFDRQVMQEGFVFNLGFPGQYYDSETRTWNNGFRDYRADLGRYVESDPVGLVGGMNSYAYVEANPLAAADPSGLSTAVLVGGGTMSNPAGHVAMAFTGRGIYSYGTTEKFGTSTTDYLASQGTYRSTTAYVLDTTPEQEQKMIDFLETNYSGGSAKKYSIFNHDCATAVNGALGEAGIGAEGLVATAQAGGVLLPNLPLTSGVIARSFPGMQVFQIPQGASIPGIFRAFNPGQK